MLSQASDSRTPSPERKDIDILDELHMKNMELFADRFCDTLNLVDTSDDDVTFKSFNESSSDEPSDVVLSCCTTPEKSIISIKRTINNTKAHKINNNKKNNSSKEKISKNNSKIQFSRSSVGGSKYLMNVHPNIAEDSELVFESRFESGNLAKAVKITSVYYELYLRSDMYTNRHSQWFYFRVMNTRKNISYRFDFNIF